MIIELLAGRLIGRHLGGSLYTWTSIIAVVFAGMSIGNYVGGRLADRCRPARLLPWLFLMSAAGCLLCLFLNYLLAERVPLRNLDWPPRIFLTVFIIFTAPALLLGTITPVTAKMAVERCPQIGTAIGAIYAWGAVGSILGTLATGFFLIPSVGSTNLVFLTAGGLALLGVWLQLLARSQPATPIQPLAQPVGTPAETEVRTEPAATDPRLRLEPVNWAYAPHTIVFISAACLMALEIVAGRLIARHLGTSLYTWTSVIGVVLAGMSVGYYLGGRLADWWNPARFIGWLCLVSSAAGLAALLLNEFFANASPLSGLRWPSRVFISTLSVFLLPSIALGTISPAVVKLALSRSKAVGATIGAVYAMGTVGSILGTLLTGFWLFAAMGSLGVVLAVVLGLAALGWCLGPHRWAHAVWLSLVILILVAARADPAQLHPKITTISQRLGFREDVSDALFLADSNYQFVKVTERNSESSTSKVRVLSLDYLIHAYVDLESSNHLEYDYERVYRDVTRRYAEGKDGVSAFFIGGGGYTFPRWVLCNYPTAKIDVAEIDPMVEDANHRAMGLPYKTPIRTYIGDARNVVDSLPATARYDFFFGDAFNDLSIPWHLITVEFARKVRQHMKPDGAYLLNVIENFDNGLLLGACYLTLKQVFKHVYVFCTEPDGVSHRRDTFVLAASDQPIDLSDWLPKHGGDFEGSALTAENLDDLAKKCGGLVLTDDFAPVENLLAPVVKMRKH